MKASTRVLGIVSVALGAASAPTWADNDSRDSLSELSAQWWQWALSIPPASSPFNDLTGANCVIGQRGPVWFLVGATSSAQVQRNCTVPEGVSLFFPIINNFNLNTPNVCGSDATSLTVPQLRALVAPFADAATGLAATLDMKAIKHIRRVRSVPFSASFPADNIFVAGCAPGGFPAGTYSPGVDDGHYVKLDGLSPGSHTLNFRGASGAFSLNVTYILNVVPVPKQARD